MKTRPELAKWHRSTDANRREIAAQYQEEFRRSAYQYDQDLSWWRKARTSFPFGWQDRRPQAAALVKRRTRSSSLHGSEEGSAVSSEEDQIVALPPEQAAQIAL